MEEYASLLHGVNDLKGVVPCHRSNHEGCPVFARLLTRSTHPSSTRKPKIGNGGVGPCLPSTPASLISEFAIAEQHQQLAFLSSRIPASTMWKISTIGALLFAGVASASRPGDQVCTLSADNQCAADSLTPSTLDESVLIYPGGKTRCAFDDFTDPAGNFNTSKTFFFQVFPNKAQDKSKLLLYFQGGGACSGADTCGFSLQCSLGASHTFNPNAEPGSSGALNRTNSDNLFKDWNIVHIPYCTGDLHIGNATQSVPEGVFEAFLNQSQCRKQNMTTYLNGFENTQSALKWALANYPNPEHLIIGGSSAGSLAAQALSTHVANLWKVEGSSIRYSMLGDSYVGVLPDDEKPSSVVLDYFGACDVDLSLPADVVTACKNHSMGVVELMSSLIKEVPYSDWLFIDSKADRTQRLFYELLKQGILGYPFTNLISPADFFGNMTTMINAYKTVSSRISTFFVEGEKHVFLYYEGYGATVSDTGVLLGEYLTTWLLPHNATDSSTAPTTAPSSAAPAPTVSLATMAAMMLLAVWSAI
ncbi:Gpi-anchored leucine-rich lipoprotein, partial [Globisporangium splendens]